jgi:hypothetical protein
VLTICPTADYELYLGCNLLPPEQVLFQPTRGLLAVWEEYGVRGTLFPDVCSAWRHRELHLDDFAARFDQQLCDALVAGHDVQLHLHPEWLSATHTNGAWRFAPRTGSLHDLGFEPQDPAGAPALLRRGRAYLEDLLRPLRPEYRCRVFRAGGWILQPEAQLARALLDAGLRADATVIPGVRLLRTDYRIDFRAVPDRTYWFVSPAAGIGVDSGRREDVLEVAIGSYRGSFRLFHHVLSELRLRRRARRAPEPRRGWPMTKVGPRASPLRRLVGKYRKLTIPRVFDAADTHEAMLATLGSYLRHYDCVGCEHVVCMNGHPKDTYDVHLAELRRFFAAVQRRYSGVVRFEPLAAAAARLLGD